MDTCPNYQRLYSPFRAGGEKAAARKLTKGNLVLVETAGAANYGVTAPVTSVDAFIVQLSLLTCERSELFLDGRHVDGMEHSARSVQIHNLRRSPISDIRDPFHVLYFYVPCRMLDALSAEMRAAPIEEMQTQPRAAGGRDPIVEHLMLSALPALDRPGELNELFAEHLMKAPIHRLVTNPYAALRMILPHGLAGQAGAPCASFVISKH